MVGTDRPLALTIITILLLESGVGVSSFTPAGVGRNVNTNMEIVNALSFSDPQRLHLPVASTSKLKPTSSSSSHPSSPSTTSTSLSMGLRSFFRRGGKDKNDDNNNDKNKSKKPDEDPEDVKAALEAIKADLEAVAQKEKAENLREKIARARKKNLSDSVANATPASAASSAPTPTTVSSNNNNNNNNNESSEKSKSRVKMALNDMKNSISSPSSAQVPIPAPASSRYGETVRDRVKRVKSGAMTEDEKMAFLNNALTPRSAPGKKGPRIRQPIPEPSDGRNNPSNAKAPANSSFRNDSLFNRVMGTGKSIDRPTSRQSYDIGDVVGGSDSAKRQYLDMVTDPNRFASYAAMNANKPDDDDDDDDDDDMKADVLGNLKSVLNNNDEEDDSDSLGNRLQSAAILKEQQDAELKAKRDLERETEKARIAEAQKQAAEEFRKREESKIKTIQDERERILKAEQEKKESEEDRQSSILAAQEDYWAKQLKNNASRGQNVMSDEDKERNLQQATEAVVNEVRSEQVDESQILVEAAEDDLHERELNAERVEKSAAQVTHTVPQPILNDVSPDAFVHEQERRKAALDQLVEDQKARLATLNSPLPTPPPEGTVMPVSNVPPPSAFINSPTNAPPPAPIPFVNSPTNSPPPANNPPPAPSPPPSPFLPFLTDLPPPAPVPAKAPAPAPATTSRSPAPGLSLSELTMNAQKKKANNPRVSTPTPAPAPANNSAPVPSLNLREMTMLNNRKTAANVKKPAPSPSSSPSGPIRQTIKDMVDADDEDDDDVDFFEYSRNGGNKNMSIKDIMQAEGGDSSKTDKASEAKQKSKMWGIDIDKFDL